MGVEESLSKNAGPVTSRIKVLTVLGMLKRWVSGCFVCGGGCKNVR